jgi:hypothetical protein
MGVQNQSPTGGELAAMIALDQRDHHVEFEMPPEQVILLPSISNSEGATVMCGKASLRHRMLPMERHPRRPKRPARRSA